MTRLLSAVLVLTLAGCATGYHAQGYRGGYADRWQSERTVTITYNGNAYVSPERVAEYALLRACELTLERGFTHFRIAGDARRIDERSYVTAETFLTGQRHVSRKPRVELTAVLLDTDRARELEEAGAAVISARFYVEQNAPATIRDQILGG